MRANADTYDGVANPATSPTALLVALWAVGWGLGSVALWETLELLDVVLRHDVVYDGLAFVVLVYLAGSALGLAHGGAVAYLGRIDVGGRRKVRRQIQAGALLAIPLCLAGLTVGWPIALTSHAVQTDRLSNWLVPVGSWLVAGLAVLLAVACGEDCVRRVYSRSRLGVAGAILAMVVLTASWAALLIAGRSFSLTFEARVVASGIVAITWTVWVVLPMAVCCRRLTGRTRAVDGPPPSKAAAHSPVA